MSHKYNNEGENVIEVKLRRDYGKDPRSISAIHYSGGNLYFAKALDPIYLNFPLIIPTLIPALILTFY